MNLPEVKNDNIRQHLSSEEIVIETAQQIMKDFGLFGIEITFSAPVDEAYQELHNQLVYQIERLYVNDYSRLLSVLYQVDITDKQIARSAEELPQYSAIEVIAHEVIVRDLKKVLLRRYFKNQQ